MDVDIIIETEVSNRDDLIPFMETITIKDVNLFRVSTSQREQKVIFNINQYKFEYKTNGMSPLITFYDLVRQEEKNRTGMDQTDFFNYYRRYKNKIENIIINLVKKERYDKDTEYFVWIEYQLKS